MAQLSQKFKVNTVTIPKWKTEFLTNMSAAFSNLKETQSDDQDVPVEKLYAQIGKLKVELDFFLKKSAKKLGIPESEWKAENLKMMSLMDKHLTVHPTEGVVSMVDWLQEQGYPVGPKRIRRMFKLMAHDTIFVGRT